VNYLGLDNLFKVSEIYNQDGKYIIQEKRRKKKRKEKENVESHVLLYTIVS
jgi:hypothetical protein